MEPKTITIDEYAKMCASQMSVKKLAENKCTQSDITSQQCDKYDISSCVVVYLNGAAKNIICINPIFWASTNYYISDTMYANDDTEKKYPFKVFVGDED
jgi:hypothetical protein